ncbi:NUC169 domain-containing protein [Blastocladiella britannica]|nr:NUC169 domain-containing protein [Blastocladiella britannica]
MPPKRAGIKRRLREVDSVDPVAVLPTPPATSSDAASSSGRGEEDASSSDDEDYMAAEIDAGSDDSDGSEEGDHDDDDDDDDDEVLADEDRELSEYPHIGYDLDGKKIMRPATADELDKFLSKMDDPKFWTSVHDKVEQKDVELTEEELNIIHKLQSADYAAEGFDPYQDTVEWFTSDTMIAPLTATPEPKRRFVPSKWEHKKVMKIVRAIRNGWIVPRKPQTEAARYFDVWGASETSENRLDHPMHLPAPKAKLPGNIESYNPPAEYLFSEEERKAWEETEPEHRKLDFIPQKYDSLRKVPAYERFVHDRFNRCLDLYLCPRVRKTRVRFVHFSFIYIFSRRAT